MRTRTTQTAATVLAVAALLGTLARSTTERVQAQDKAPAMADPLPSWREGKAKNAILDFVRHEVRLGQRGFTYEIASARRWTSLTSCPPGSPARSGGDRRTEVTSLTLTQPCRPLRDEIERG